VAVGRNDNYDLIKKVQSSGGFINMSGKKDSVVWPSVGMLFSSGLFWKFGGTWLHIIFQRIVLEKAQI
jgi:hypothetical protein